MSPMFTCFQVILRHSGIDYLMISRAKLILVVLGGNATLEILETKWVLPKNRPGPAIVFDVAGRVWLTCVGAGGYVISERTVPYKFCCPPTHCLPRADGLSN